MKTVDRELSTSTSECAPAKRAAKAAKKAVTSKRLVKELRVTMGAVSTDLVDELFGGDEAAAEAAILALLDNGELSWGEIDVRPAYGQSPSFMAGLRRRCWELGAATLTETVLVSNKLSLALLGHRAASNLDLLALAAEQNVEIVARYVRFKAHSLFGASLSPEHAQDLAADLASRPKFPAFDVVVPDADPPNGKRFESVTGDPSLQRYLERLDPSRSWEATFHRVRDGVAPTQYDRAMKPSFLVDAEESVVREISGAQGVPRFFTEDAPDEVLAGARAGIERLKTTAPSDSRRALISVLIQAAFIRCEQERVELAPYVNAQSWSHEHSSALIAAMRSMDTDVRAAALRSGLVHSPNVELLQWLDDQPLHSAYREAVLVLAERSSLIGAPAYGSADVVEARASVCRDVLATCGESARWHLYLHMLFPNLEALQRAGADMSPWVGSVQVGEMVKADAGYRKRLDAFAGALPEALRDQLGVAAHRHPAIALGPSIADQDVSIVRFDLAGKASGGDAWRGGTLASGRRVVIMLSTNDVPEWRERLPNGAVYVVLSVGPKQDVALDVHRERPRVHGGAPLRLERTSIPRGAFQSDDDEGRTDDEAADALIVGDGHALGGAVWRRNALESERAFLFQLNGEADWQLPSSRTYYVLANRIEEQ